MYTLENDFKDLIHILGNTKDDIDLLLNVLRKINKENENGKEQRKPYKFGPMIMRVFHFYGLDDVAIQVNNSLK